MWGVQIALYGELYGISYLDSHISHFFNCFGVHAIEEIEHV